MCIPMRGNPTMGIPTLWVPILTVRTGRMTSRFRMLDDDEYDDDGHER
jgi:hypothetical protein